MVEPQIKSMSVLWMYAGWIGERVQSLDATARSLIAHFGGGAYVRQNSFGAVPATLRAIARVDRKFASLGYTRTLRFQTSQLEAMPAGVAASSTERIPLTLSLLLHANGAAVVTLSAQYHSKTPLPGDKAIEFSSLGLLYERPTFFWPTLLPSKPVLRWLQTAQDHRVGQGKEGLVLQLNKDGLVIGPTPMRYLVEGLIFPWITLAAGGKKRGAQVAQQLTCVAIWDAFPAIDDEKEFVEKHGTLLGGLVNMDRWSYYRPREMVGRWFSKNLSIDYELGVYAAVEGVGIVCRKDGLDVWHRHSAKLYGISDREAAISDALYHYLVFFEWALLEQSTTQYYLKAFAVYSGRTGLASWRRIFRLRQRLLLDLEHLAPDGITEFSYGRDILKVAREQLEVPVLLQRLEDRRSLLESIVSDRTNRSTERFVTLLNIVAMAGVALGLADVLVDYIGISPTSSDALMLKAKAVGVGVLALPTLWVLVEFFRWVTAKLVDDK